MNIASPKLIENNKLQKMQVFIVQEIPEFRFSWIHMHRKSVKDCREQRFMNNFWIHSVFNALFFRGYTNMNGIITYMLIPRLRISIGVGSLTW